ncbi:threonylcarbamoyl-AMP synthase [Lacrimispora sp. NSJ-141]|uniref:Threonylcarbamoyl-AMP synthase n=1 Tax=Lientehia hominis TaxID=2897778 RepID=A0AAP2RKH7_9FIRM|nr:L-threonylcarbamoyladenylate synthase [Lientehia hominis]MCD2493174.1 threonylcarbamoyl-AMP synthase [Lientehia hominis]
MITKVVKIDESNISREAVQEAGRILAGGGLVAFPTETVYGLGANGMDARAAAKIYEAKGRPSDNPLILHIARMEELEPLAAEIPEEARALASAFWPGPMTMILKKTAAVPYETTGGLETVAVRMPSHPVANGIISAAGVPIAAPSANKSGRPSPTKASHVIEDMDGKIDMIVDGGEVGIGLESTIIDVSEGIPTVLRPGYITMDMIRRITGRAELDKASMGQMAPGVHPKAPGMKYRHYAPKAELTIFRGRPETSAAAISAALKKAASEGKKAGVICTEESIGFYEAPVKKCVGSRRDPETIAHNLYDVLRAFDEERVDCIFSESFEDNSLSGAIMNRLIKASGHRIVECQE